MKPSSYLADLLKRYLHDDTTEGEAWTVEQWYEARDMPRPPAPTPAEQAAAKARMWRQVQARTRSRPALRWRTSPRRRAAAALLLVLSLGVGLSWWSTSRHRTGPAGGVAASARPRTAQVRADGNWLICTNSTARPVALALADGSSVRLAAGSRLRYPARFGNAPERVVTLQGEAFFEVFHDPARPFRVLTDQVETTVLGTSFTVRAFPGQAEALVMVRTGRVRVRPRAGAATNAAGTAAGAPAPGLLLQPNQQVRYSAARPALQAELVADPAPMRAPTLRFDQAPVARVLAALEADYGVPIRYDGAALAGCTVNLTFSHESLFEKLDLLCKTLDASYERQGEAVVFRSRGCQRD